MIETPHPAAAELDALMARQKRRHALKRRFMLASAIMLGGLLILNLALYGLAGVDALPVILFLVALPCLLYLRFESAMRLLFPLWAILTLPFWLLSIYLGYQMACGTVLHLAARDAPNYPLPISSLRSWKAPLVQGVPFRFAPQYTRLPEPETYAILRSTPDPGKATLPYSSIFLSSRQGDDFSSYLNSLASADVSPNYAAVARHRVRFCQIEMSRLLVERKVKYTRNTHDEEFERLLMILLRGMREAESWEEFAQLQALFCDQFALLAALYPELVKGHEATISSLLLEFEEALPELPLHVSQNALANQRAIISTRHVQAIQNHAGHSVRLDFPPIPGAVFIYPDLPKWQEMTQKGAERMVERRLVRWPLLVQRHALDQGAREIDRNLAALKLPLKDGLELLNSTSPAGFRSTARPGWWLRPDPMGTQLRQAGPTFLECGYFEYRMLPSFIKAVNIMVRWRIHRASPGDLTIDAFDNRPYQVTVTSESDAQGRPIERLTTYGGLNTAVTGTPPPAWQIPAPEAEGAYLYRLTTVRPR